MRGDLLFNGSSETPEEVALSAVVDFDPDPSTFLNSFCFGFRLRSDAEVDPTFLAYFFRSATGRGLVSSLAQGATRYNIAKTKFLDVRLDLPSLQRQREIATSLCDADDLIATLERLIAKKQAIKQGMMQQLLTGRTRLPGFTGEWTDIRLGDHVSYVKTVALSRAQLDTKSPLKYLHYGDIHTRSSVLLDAVGEEMPRASALLAGRAGQLRCGDLVFADASEDPAGVGKSVEIVDVPSGGVVPGLHTIAARFDKSVLADGFKAYLQFIPSFREQLLRLAAGTKVLATTRSYISSVILTLPDIAEQKAIAEVLHDSEREIDTLRVRLSKARDMKTGMMQQLLTGRSRLPVEAES
ncbi:restriction endonuclease subunit S [Nocardia farcinica]|nr:restriction endonuclease subunit S [Nocardia farcinica]MBF6410440.1 restriction endonuclease subunit S [Nocardia farcinica]